MTVIRSTFLKWDSIAPSRQKKGEIYIAHVVYFPEDLYAYLSVRIQRTDRSPSIGKYVAALVRADAERHAINKGLAFDELLRDYVELFRSRRNDGKLKTKV
jgi:hypothetical protein